MRLVTGPGELAGAVAASQREAASAFGSDEVFLERYLEAPRHVEVQVLGDDHGHVVHLFDRECSVQRRHQKLVEEAPAVLVALEVRGRMWDAAVAVATAVRYSGAGTVEFLVDGDAFFFLEMNTRLQVEHGVTELVTGVDLVDLGLRVAAGLPLPFAQSDLSTAGHAVEVRLCAERPREDYRPTPGAVAHARWPVGPGIRCDRGIETGTVVSPAYDSLVAKLMAHGPDRNGAVARLARALRVLELDGLETNRELLAAVLDDGAFREGALDVHYLERRPDLRDAAPPDEVRRLHAAAVAARLLHERGAQSIVPVRAPGWRNVGVPLHTDVLTDSAGTLQVRAPAPDAPLSVSIDGDWRAIATWVIREGAVDLTAEADGVRRRYAVRHTPHAAYVNGPEGQSTFALRAEDDPDERGGVAGECRAPLPGAITKILVAVGDTVAEGDGLVVLEAMKMEHTLRAHGAGIVSQVHAAAGQQVDVGELLVVVDPQATREPEPEPA
jgi:acetyl/propionyl-CoA carboxylase alpha subunit